MPLQGALDNDVHIAVQRFISSGVSADAEHLYIALQRSNSSLKRKQKKVILASIDRVLDFIGVTAQEDPAIDSEAEIERAEAEAEAARAADLMNRSIRANLIPKTAERTPPSLQSNGDDDVNKRRYANGEALPKRIRRGNEDKISVAAPEGISMDDLGGMEEVIEKIERLVVYPMCRPQDFQEGNILITKGILLHGPPGCGKTMLVRATAAELGVPFIEILGPSVVSGVSGESEKGIREKFEEAKKHAPCLIFIDEIDAIAPKRESSQSSMEKRMVAQLLVSMDELDRGNSKPVIVLAATNLPDNLDPALRRGGRFGTEIMIPVPDQNVRKHILQTLLRRRQLDIDVDFEKLSKMTAGFVGADLQDLVDQSGFHQMERCRKALLDQASALNLCASLPNSRRSTLRNMVAYRHQPDIPRPPGFEILTLRMADFLAVLPNITPSSKREGFATVPNVTWDDIGALESLRQQLEESIVQPIQNPELYENLGSTVPSGVLLWGPPGCGKTLLAKAVAAESRANFISVKGPELLNKFVGESEAAVRKVFTRARSSTPCVIFFDELDALVPKRSDAGTEASTRVVNTMLTELDGLEARTGIYVIGATNRPDMIDEAMLRPGRFETPLFVDLPQSEERVGILRTLLRKRPCDFTDGIANCARNAIDFSGADLGALVTKAVRYTVQRKGNRIELADFVLALEQIVPSVRNPEEYRRMAVERFGR